MTRVEFKKGAKVERWEKSLANPTKALKQIGLLMVAESQAAFRNQRFDGKAWRPRGEVNTFGIIADFAQGKKAPAERRFQRTPALMDTGALVNSIAFRVIGTKAVEVGTVLPYASVHQTGGETESDTITPEVQALLWKWLKKQGPKMRSKLGWLLNKKYRGETITGTVPKRPFVGITKSLRKNVGNIVGVKLMEVK